MSSFAACRGVKSWESNGLQNQSSCAQGRSDAEVILVPALGGNLTSLPLWQDSDRSDFDGHQRYEIDQVKELLTGVEGWDSNPR